MKSKTIELNNDDFNRFIMHEATEVAILLTKHIHEHTEIRLYGMTVIGYAVEMLLHTAAQGKEEEHDRLSKDWLNFMKQAHIDIKRIGNVLKMQGS